MSENNRSSLNPFAISFIPNKENEMSSIKETAVRYLQELVESKKAKGEDYLTKLEMANVVGKLITLRYKSSNAVDRLRVDRFLNDKILNSERLHPKLSSMPISKEQSFTKFTPFNVSRFQPPKRTFLLVAFWGLYRYEQALRPLLSLTSRPQIVHDKVWSLEPSDMKVWNTSCVEKVCRCPPVFGYIIPSSFFGPPFHINYTCSEDRIHLNHYAENTDGNEYILTRSCNNNSNSEYPFEEDVPSYKEVATDLNDLKEQFESTVTAICSLLSDFEEPSGTDQQVEDLASEDHQIVDSSIESFWDEDGIWNNLKVSHVPFSKQNLDDLEDSNDHPLLEIPEFPPHEEVSQEIEEMIRRSLSPKKDFHILPKELAFEDIDLEDEPEEVICVPPCSIWCDSPYRSNDDGQTSEVGSEPNTPTEEVLKIDLLSADQLDSLKEADPEKAKTIFLEPTLQLVGAKARRPSFRRCFSINDCDPSYYDQKFGLNGSTAQASVSPKDMLAFLKKDPVNFFKNFTRSNSWKDTDSGFVSHWSSHEDINGDRSDPEDSNSMWGFVSGEDSLWKPLPECAIQNIEEENPMSHRRVRDLRRQLSLN